MARTVWDDVEPAPGPSAPARPAPPQRRGRLPWLLFALAAVAGLAVAGGALEDDARARRELGAARDEAAEMRQLYLRTQGVLTSTEKARAAEAAKAAQLEEELSTRGDERAADAKLIAELRERVDAKEGEVSAEGRRIALNFVDEILFPSGEAELSARGQAVLARVGPVLRGLKDQQILVGGHTDDRPIHNARFPSNWELSAARAVNVARYLVETVGVDPHAVAAAAYSQFHARGRDRARNRRIELLLTPTVEVKR
jgi:chemotaxis protein MotB